MRRTLTAVLLGAAALAGAAEAARELPSAEVIASARAAVVRVQARDCADGQDRDGSGFLFGGADRVVTALHVVANCGRIAIYREETQATVLARLAKSDAPSDLAILTLDRALAATPLPLTQDALKVNDRMVAIGYAIGQPTMSDTALRLASGESRLRHMLNTDARRMIETAGAPALDLEILRLDGHLLPGLSGAPIVDDRGHVVGVGDGGLEGGAVSISWGVPAAALARLDAATATPPPPVGVARAAPLFAADAPMAVEEPASAEGLICGERRFRKLRTRPFAALAETSDSPLALEAYKAAAVQAGIDPMTFSFDIYVEAASGAAIAIPAGWTVSAETDDGYCVAEHPERAVEVRFLGRTITDYLQGFQTAADASAALLDGGLYIPHLDLAWTYPAPFVRPDGLMVNRTAAALEPQPFSGLSPGYAVETVLLREDLLVDVVAFDRSPCRYQPYAPGCDPARPVPIAFVEAALGAGLSTMPCGPVGDAALVRQLLGPGAQAWPNAFCTGG